VVPGDDHHRRHLGQVEKAPPDDLLGGGCRSRRVEDIAGDHHELDLGSGGNRHQLGQNRPVLFRPVPAPDPSPDMPIGGVENLHCHRVDRKEGG